MSREIADLDPPRALSAGRRSPFAAYGEGTRLSGANAYPRTGTTIAARCIMLNPEVEDPSVRKSADLTPVSEIMATDVIAVRPELRVEDLEELLLARGISGAPVIDDAGRPIGIVSKTDLLRRKGAAAGDGARVRDIMVSMAFCLSESESIARAAGLMAFEGVHRVPVVGPRGMVTGVVSPLDVMRWLARQHGYPISNRR